MVYGDQPTGSSGTASSEPGVLAKYGRLLKKYGVMASGYWPGESKTSISSSSSRCSSREKRKKTALSMGPPLDENGDAVLTDAQYQAFQEAFELFDKNGGGTIDAAELQKTLDDCGIYVNGDDLVEIMLSLDHDGNGEVDFREFIEGVSQFSVKGDKESKLKFAFRIYDMDNDGTISNGELFQVLKMMVGNNLKDTQLQQIVDKTILFADKDEDGKISFDEFCAVVGNTEVHKKMVVDV